MLLPACMVLYHDYLEPKANLCCFCCSGATSSLTLSEVLSS